jgi:hypothetical protein
MHPETIAFIEDLPKTMPMTKAEAQFAKELLIFANRNIAVTVRVMAALLCSISLDRDLDNERKLEALLAEIPEAKE